MSAYIVWLDSEKAHVFELNAESTSKLRRKCFEKQIELVVVKNTLFIKRLGLLN